MYTTRELFILQEARQRDLFRSERDLHYLGENLYSCSVLQCVAVCCSVLQCVAVSIGVGVALRRHIC